MPSSLIRDLAAITVCVASALVATSTVDAQVERPHLVRGSLGGGKLVGSPQNSDFGLGFGFGGGYEYRFHRFLGAGLDYQGHVFPVHMQGADGTGSLHAIGPSLQIHPLPNVSLGDLHVDLGPDLVVTGGLARFGIHAGVAFDFRITDLIAVGPYLRYRHDFAPSGGGATDPKLIAFGAEVTLAFGRRDRVDAPAESAAPVTEPPSDRDGDGIDDSRDRCPADAEDLDGQADDDGCPDPDDRDADGLVDRDDACPLEPEVVNGYEDDDGCPDVAPAPESEAIEPPPVDPPPARSAVEPAEATPSEPEAHAETIASLGCDTGEAETHASHDDELDAIARQMQADPTIRLLLIGHADPIGTTASNEALSRRRALHVRAELIGRGVDPHRVRARWYGERRPIDRGTDEVARAHNRTVEIRRE